MRRAVKRLVALVAVLLLVLVVACAPPPAEITPTPTPTPEPTPAPAPTSIPAPTPEPTPTPTPAGFFLKVTEPKDESIVTTSTIHVSGMTTVDAVLSINGEIGEIDEHGNFSTVVTLDEGPNYIEVIASDLEENQEVVTLLIIYLP